MIIDCTHQSNNPHQEDLAPRDNELLQVFHQSTMPTQRYIIWMLFITMIPKRVYN